MKIGLRAGVSFGALVSGLWPSFSVAQDAATRIEAEAPLNGDIIVTARKREERLQDVPGVVSAVTKDRLDDLLGRASSTRDVIALLPGVTFINSAANTTGEPNIRGAGQARQANSDSAIGLYRSGAYIVGGNLGGRTFQRFDLFDVERIEVLRGPQGALYGRNAVGGAINVISARPSFSFASEIEAFGGSQQDYGSRGTVNIPVSDKFALRGGYDVEQRDSGFYLNTFNNQIQDTSSYAAGRVSARLRPTSSLDIVFTADVERERGDPGTTISIPDPDGNQFTSAYNGPATSGANQTNFSLNVDWNVNFAKLVSVTNYRTRRAYLNFDNDGTVALSEVNTNDDDAKTFFQELRLQGGGERLNWLVGADYFYLSDTYLQVQSGRAIIPGTKTKAAINPNFTQNVAYKQTGYSIFGSLDNKLTDKLSVQGEARYSIDDKSQLIQAVRADGTPRYTDFPVGSPQTMPSRSFKNPSFGGTLSYKLAPTVLTFARVSTAYRAGGFNNELGNPCGVGEVPGTSCNLVNVPPEYGEEHSINYEVGLKTTAFQKQLTLNSNVYLIKYTDILANLDNGIKPMVDPLNGAMFLTNAGNATAWGFEIEMALKPKLPRRLGSLTLDGTLGHQEGHFDTINPGITTVLPGNQLARLRPFTAQADVVWRVPIANKIYLFFSGNYIREEGGYQDGENKNILSSYNTFNASLGLERGNLSLTGRINNLTNEEHFLNQSGAATTTPGISTNYRRNDPQSFQIALKWKWGT